MRWWRCQYFLCSFSWFAHYTAIHNTQQMLKSCCTMCWIGLIKLYMIKLNIGIAHIHIRNLYGGNRFWLHSSYLRLVNDENSICTDTCFLRSPFSLCNFRHKDKHFNVDVHSNMRYSMFFSLILLYGHCCWSYRQSIWTFYRLFVRYTAIRTTTKYTIWWFSGRCTTQILELHL